MYYFQSWLNNNKGEKFYYEAMLWWTVMALCLYNQACTLHSRAGERAFTCIFGTLVRDVWEPWAWITQIRYLSRVHIWILKLQVHNNDFFAETESFRSQGPVTRDFWKSYSILPRYSTPLNISAYAQPTIKYVRHILSQRWNSFRLTPLPFQDDEIPEMKMRKQLFELVKFLRGASRNLWSFLQAGTTAGMGRGNQGGPHRAESTDGAIGHVGTTVAFHGQFQGYFGHPFLLFIRARYM